MTADRPTTEPRTEAGRALLMGDPIAGGSYRIPHLDTCIWWKVGGRCDGDCGVLPAILAIEAEAAQGAAPRPLQTVSFDLDDEFWQDWFRNWFLYGTVYAINHPEPRVVDATEITVHEGLCGGQKSIEQLAAEKGIGPLKSADDLRIDLTDEEADAFMEAMESEGAASPSALDVHRLGGLIERAIRDSKRASGGLLPDGWTLVEMALAYPPETPTEPSQSITSEYDARPSDDASLHVGDDS